MQFNIEHRNYFIRFIRNRTKLMKVIFIVFGDALFQDIIVRYMFDVQLYISRSIIFSL